MTERVTKVLGTHEFLALMSERYCSASLECNNHKACCRTATQEIEDEHSIFENCTPEDLAVMKATDTIWCLQIYPNSPVGFNVWYGSTMERVIELARKELGV